MLAHTHKHQGYSIRGIFWEKTILFSKLKFRIALNQFIM